MIKIVFAIFQTGAQSNGGVESITQIIEHLSAVKPIIVTQIKTPVNQRWENFGFDVHIWAISYKIGRPFGLNIFSKLSRISSLVDTNYKTWKLIRETGTQIWHCNDPSAFWHTAFGAWLGKAKIIFNVRDVKPTSEKYSWKWHIAFQISNYQVVLSQEMRDVLIQRLSIPVSRQPRIKYIYSIVNHVKFHPILSEQKEWLRQELGIEPGVFAIGYVANFNHKKQQLEFIQAAGKHLKAQVPHAKVYFIGDFEPENNTYAHECWEAVSQQDLQEVCSFLGFQSNIAAWYQALDLVIVPTKNEGLARCMIESLACGTPVISFNVCSAQEILINYNCGSVVPMGDYTLLVSEIARFAQDEQLMSRYRENAAKVSHKLFSEKNVSEYEKIYNQILKY